MANRYIPAIVCLMVIGLILMSCSSWSVFKRVPDQPLVPETVMIDFERQSVETLSAHLKVMVSGDKVTAESFLSIDRGRYYNNKDLSISDMSREQVYFLAATFSHAAAIMDSLKAIQK